MSPCSIGRCAGPAPRRPAPVTARAAAPTRGGPSPSEARSTPRRRAVDGTVGSRAPGVMRAGRGLADKSDARECEYLWRVRPRGAPTDSARRRRPSRGKRGDARVGSLITRHVYSLPLRSARVGGRPESLDFYFCDSRPPSYHKSHHDGLQRPDSVLSSPQTLFVDRGGGGASPGTRRWASRAPHPTGTASSFRSGQTSLAWEPADLHLSSLGS